MKLAHRFVLAIAVPVFGGLWLPYCLAQDAVPSGQPIPAVSGTGLANHIAVWKNTTTLGYSMIYATGGNVGIGTTAPAAKLEVNGNTQVDGNLALSGNILSNGGVPIIQAPNNGSNNFSAGLGSLPTTTTGPNNTAVGDSALHANTNGLENTAIGYGALAANTTGAANTATGYSALYSNTEGGANTAAGDSALYSNTTGTGNTASGHRALATNTTGSFNAASGAAALTDNTTGSNNTASGSGALFLNTTGGANTANGSNALSANTTGADNTADGYGTLTSNTTGSYNVAIGSGAGFNITGTSNNIHISNAGIASDSGAIRIGTAGTQTSAFVAGISNVNVSGAQVLINSSGQLGVASSSRRYKEEIQDMGETSSGLMRLRPVTFRYKKAYEDGSKPIQFGLIAEEVAEVYPDLVARSADGQIETVKYQLLDPMLLNELQRQHATIATQKEQIRSLEERLAKVEAALQGTNVTTSSQ